MTPLLSSSLLRGQTDERLVELAAAGHDRAFEAIVERYRRQLQRYLRRLLSDTLAEDVVQATFINAWSSLRTGTEVRDLRPWLYRIAHNAAINALNKVGEAMEEVPESVGGFAAEPAAELERRDEMHRALTSIAALPSRQRAALLAVAVDGRAHSDVARDLGLTDGAVRQLVHRARTTLRGAITALTPMPLLHALMASAGDSTVARVAEVAAGAGGAGAASVSLKAGAAAVLATGALVTGGPELKRVVAPHARPAPAPEAAAPAKSKPSASTSPASFTTAAQAPAATSTAGGPPSSSSSSSSSQSGRTHSPRRKAKSGSSSPHKSTGGQSSGKHRSSTENSGSGSGRHRSSGHSGNEVDTGTSGRGSGGGDENQSSGRDVASGSRDESGGGKTDATRSGGDENLVVRPPTTATPSGGGGDESGGDHVQTAPAPETAPTTTEPTTTTPPPPTPTVSGDTAVRTEPAPSGDG